MLKVIKETKYNNCISTTEHECQSLNEAIDKFKEWIREEEKSSLKPASNWLVSDDTTSYYAENINNPEEYCWIRIK